MRFVLSAFMMSLMVLGILFVADYFATVDGRKPDPFTVFNLPQVSRIAP